MNLEKIEISVPGQVSGAAVLHTYLLDRISVAENRKRPAVIVCAGGGYRICSDRESEPIVTQFLAMGYHSFLLEYSVDPNRFPTSLLELACAVAQIREHSEAWCVDPDKILLCGFSAAGHLCCSLGVFWNQEWVYEAIGKRPEMIRPNGMILAYPVVSSGEFAHKNSFLHLLGEHATEEEKKRVSLELHVGKDMPPAFIWHTYTDETVPVENSLLLAMAMRRQDIRFELHIYPIGGHGLSLASEETAGEQAELIVPVCRSWISLAKTWIEGL
ncbi:MAG: alpha/beta hydrolase [Hungatella sp.]